MGQRTTRSVTISLPPVLVDELDRIRRRDRRSRSELLRDALERYLATSQISRVAVARPEETAAIRLGREDLARGAAVRLEDIQNELGLPTR